MRPLLLRYSLVLPMVVAVAAAQSETPRVEDVLQVAGAYVRGPFNGFVTGAAKYSRYRQFRVETSESIKQ